MQDMNKPLHIICNVSIVVSSSVYFLKNYLFHPQYTVDMDDTGNIKHLSIFDQISLYCIICNFGGCI